MIIQDRLFQTADSALNQLTKQLINSKSLPTLSKPVSDAKLFLKASWWNANASRITIDNHPVQYVVERLSHQPCLIVSGDKQPGAGFYRITTRISKNNDEYHRVLQDVIALPDTQAQTVCKDPQNIRTIPFGLQSWSQLN